jgi:hypothetical protein
LATVTRIRGGAKGGGDADFGGVPIAAAIERMAGIGLPPDQIARVLGVREATVRSTHAEAMALGKAKANLKVANAMFETAIDRNHPKHATMAIFWAKVHMGWREIGAGDDEPDARPSRADRMHPQPGDPEIARRFADLMQRLDAEAATRATSEHAASCAPSGPKVS